MEQLSSTFSDSKRHYQILDGLRGVAAIMVVAFHILETFTNGDHTKQIINHGYMAVDFFFLLSGFVVGYAYDDRWNRMTLGNFFRRRLIRLHPMILVGMLIGALTFYYQASSFWPQIEAVPVGKMLLVMFIGFTLIPVPLSMDIRGWQEMYPLNGPAWSLFFEYVANILYALFIRRFSNTMLAILVMVSGIALIHLAVTSPHGDVIGGWSLDPPQFRIGITRLMFPFFAGLLLQRMTRIRSIKNAFLWSGVLLVIILAMPRIGGPDSPWMNGLYDSLCIVLLFPVIVYVGACGSLKEGVASKVCRLLGDISYPVYIIHYPFIYLFMAWVANNKVYAPGEAEVPAVLVMVGTGLLVFMIVLSYACLKLYDEPARKWLTRRFLPAKAQKPGSLSIT